MFGNICQASLTIFLKNVLIQTDVTISFNFVGMFSEPPDEHHKAVFETLADVAVNLLYTDGPG